MTETEVAAMMETPTAGRRKGKKGNEKQLRTKRGRNITKVERQKERASKCIKGSEKTKLAEAEQRKAEELDEDTNGWPAEDHNIFMNIARRHNKRMEEECMKEIQKALPYMLEEELRLHKRWMFKNEGGKEINDNNGGSLQK